MYLTWHWQRSWWETLGCGQLVLIAAERAGRVVAVAPFYADSGMIFSLAPACPTTWISSAISATPTCSTRCSGQPGRRCRTSSGSGCTAYWQPRGPARGFGRPQAGSVCSATRRSDGGLVGRPRRRSRARASIGQRPTCSETQRYFDQRGTLTLRQFHDRAAILPHLETFYEQHISQWATADDESPFVERPRRAFFEHLTRTAAETGWLRFSLLDWDGRPIAFEYGSCLRRHLFRGTVQCRRRSGPPLTGAGAPAAPAAEVAR